MLFTTLEQFKSCISRDANGLFIAKYNELTLKSVFQPIYNNHLSIIGFEALVRIHTDDGITIQPDGFFHSSEEKIDDKLNVERLSRAIHLRNFAQSNYRTLQLFLNVLPDAGEQFALKDVANSFLSKRLFELDLSCQQIVLEMLELDASNQQNLQEATNALSKIGFNIAVDDFGVNASNKERVDLIAPSIIKLDRSLMLDYLAGKEEALVNAIALANKVNAKTVIEGIETREQLKLMQTLNIDMFQGYFLAIPEAISPAIIE